MADNDEGSVMEHADAIAILLDRAGAMERHARDLYESLYRRTTESAKLRAEARAEALLEKAAAVRATVEALRGHEGGA